jgi:hypothetical protein
MTRLEKAKKLNLAGWRVLQNEALADRECNGIGADWFPFWLRWLVSFVCPFLVLAADIHDMEYYYGGTENDRRAADARFLANGYILAEYHFRWIPPLKWLAEWLTRRMYRILRLFGETAWHENLSNTGKEKTQ